MLLLWLDMGSGFFLMFLLDSYIYDKQRKRERRKKQRMIKKKKGIHIINMILCSLHVVCFYCLKFCLNVTLRWTSSSRNMRFPWPNLYQWPSLQWYFLIDLIWCATLWTIWIPKCAEYRPEAAFFQTQYHEVSFLSRGVYWYLDDNKNQTNSLAKQRDLHDVCPEATVTTAMQMPNLL